MRFITLTLTEGQKLLVDKNLIIFAIEYEKYTAITLSDTRQFDILEKAEDLHSILEPKIKKMGLAPDVR